MRQTAGDCPKAAYFAFCPSLQVCTAAEVLLKDIACHVKLSRDKSTRAARKSAD